MITRTRGYLPHQDVPDETYFVTFRLFDSLPQSVLLQYREELEMKQKLKIYNPLALLDVYELKIETYLDNSFGCCWLRDPTVATSVIDALSPEIEYLLRRFFVAG
jgi:REP-associated tyrosine transposase